MRLEQVIIASLVFGFAILAGVHFIGDINSNYGTNMSTDDFSGVYDTINSTYTEVSIGQKNKTFGDPITSANTFDSALQGSFTAVRQTQNVFTIVNDIINAITTKFGLPNFVALFGIAAFLTSIVFVIIYIFVRFQPR